MATKITTTPKPAVIAETWILLVVDEEYIKVGGCRRVFVSKEHKIVPNTLIISKTLDPS